ncbi:MAG: ABC transporter ATP-binding protein [Crenarchaeota archaeon]|nr:ABC transporter ATP-binding protein [Thermoproteota archaeon]
MSSEVIVELRNVWKIYKLGQVKQVALQDINLCIQEGEFHCIIGPSGSGKSTLLSIIGGMERPSRGIVRVCGIELNRLKEDDLAKLRRDMIGFVFQQFYLIPRLTLVENVELPLIAKGVPKKERRRLALEALRAVGLEEKAYMRPSQVSGGEQQRVAIARAIVGRPRLLLADEPTGNLDVESAKKVMDIFTYLNKELGITIILATHNIELLPYCDRVTRLKGGKILRTYEKHEIEGLVRELTEVIYHRV